MLKKSYYACILKYTIYPYQAREVVSLNFSRSLLGNNARPIMIIKALMVHQSLIHSFVRVFYNDISRLV